MKTRSSLIGLAFLALGPLALANLGGGGGGARVSGGGGGGVHVSGGGGAHVSGGGGTVHFSGGGGSGNFRPSGFGGSAPAAFHPSSGGNMVPSVPAPRPIMPVPRPSGSSGIPVSPNRAGFGNPGGPNSVTVTQRPQVHPPIVPAPVAPGDFIGFRPDHPSTVPNRPNVVDRPITHPSNVVTQPGLTGRPSVPGSANNFQPNIDTRPGHPPRPPRTALPEKWQNVQNNNAAQWSHWRQENTGRIAGFQANRATQWNALSGHYRQPGWARNYGTSDYTRWRGDMRNFRIDRGREIWAQRQPFWNNCFDSHWWTSCWWNRVLPFGGGVSPWWWWQSCAWDGACAFFGSTIASQPIIYDPGTTVIYEGDTYYVDGQPDGSAADARESAIQLANPDVDQVPVPQPPAGGQPAEWLPLGVWALTQQEQGDAVMFLQLSLDKDGLLAGAYKNVMTGDEQPIVGQLDKKTQQVAWHIGNATEITYETGLSSLQNDVASVFVHFGESQTQTWLLVRLPSPDLPSGTVAIPQVGD